MCIVSSIRSLGMQDIHTYEVETLMNVQNTRAPRGNLSIVDRDLRIDICK